LISVIVEIEKGILDQKKVTEKGILILIYLYKYYTKLDDLYVCAEQ
jgi:hypothetical protein